MAKGDKKKLAEAAADKSIELHGQTKAKERVKTQTELAIWNQESVMIGHVMIEALMDQVRDHITSQKLLQLEVPYITETGLSTSLEPSLLLNFNPDKKAFILDAAQEEKEPPSCGLDPFCIERAVVRSQYDVVTSECLSNGDYRMSSQSKQSHRSPKKKGLKLSSHKKSGTIKEKKGVTIINIKSSSTCFEKMSPKKLKEHSPSPTDKDSSPTHMLKSPKRQ